MLLLSVKSVRLGHSFAYSEVVLHLQSRDLTLLVIVLNT
ncbi:hypothetical protein ROLI_029510 [Roseobacter fucihabitans]|uniref:Uncharacterized protein n=1 Tax=Roseobacter fucihabitans TaxID=1537242 RepID=A0ABZ2BX11_9RHOB|nr:hypothetical protein [Roseobacter litoralis]